MMEVIQGIIEKIVAYVPVALTIVGAFAAVAILTPNKSDDKIVQFLLDMINFIGANFGKAKNKND